MKIFSVIMILIITGLHLTPCSDAGPIHGYGHEDVALILQQHPNAAGHSHAAHPDGCSPFCHCACCTTATIVEPLTQFPITITKDNPVFSVPVPAFLINVYLPIWQPPQLMA